MFCDGDPPENSIYKLEKEGLFLLVNHNQGRAPLKIQVMRI